MKKIPFYKQANQKDCGPTCLKMISAFHGKIISTEKLRQESGISRDGVSLLGISEAAEKLGFRTTGAKITVAQLKEIELPVILHWQQSHFVVLERIQKNNFIIIDPAKGRLHYSETEFLSYWISISGSVFQEGIVLTLSPTPDFYNQPSEEVKHLELSYLFKYLLQYRQLILQLFAGLAIGSLLQLVLPFLTQSIVDIGINTRDINFIYIILIAQTMLFMGRMSVDFLRSWILLHISARLNISILTDFLFKLMKLPISYFDTKMTGDIMQRMNDQKRIESFLTGPTLGILFSFLNLIVFTVVLVYYNTDIFLIFLLSSILYSLWILFFLKKRRTLDFKRFDISSKNQSTIVQLIAGMQEIKLNNCEQQKRWEWERIQARLFRFNIKTLALGQYQQAGTFFINEGKNILITFLVAKSVIDGELTLGGMMAVQYIVGQLNSPIEQMLTFLQQLQDAKISLERLNEIREMDDEESSDKTFSKTLPTDKTISIDNLSFTYPGTGNSPVLSNIDLKIPEGKTTAIVGMSGSGKTTLIKILLRFYEPQIGEIKVGQSNLSGISYKFWRGKCGIVMQEGFIFSDNIARNIAVGDEYPDLSKLTHAIKVANITDFIQSLPLGLNTIIGAEGNGISQGQKQRILIARSVYKNPDYIFFDEATNALDSNNELIIMENLQSFFSGRTVVVVAHRLSTVKNADNIIVLDKGRIIEQGSHIELTEAKGSYFRLVKNQLELGS
ncbi:peptidase domain-containing ABC transporter [Pedobacter sp. Leaf194]|uniref:peptidase domain-containing ABC transporter n=1 Tax=Pedobacter sp. Leaf194 TaxID=1736297 RepID=UPI00070252DA|nr:peptidase domain-containing ABC transporter [Pedobacter sp. Leaf194]KQS36813.1 ABC transporter ATP-binding protein [Pedobacter sp. Leaf194]